MAYWLLKSEPDSYSIDDLERDGVSHWDGVRNFQARAHLRAMRVGDESFFYHSSTKPAGVAGVCVVEREAYPDPSQFDPSSKYYDPKARPEKPIWYMPDVRFVRKLRRFVSLDEIKRTPGLDDMVLLRRPRLSVQPVNEQQWKIINALAES